ncbi:MAG: hypothetical protein M3Y77_15015 [Actinomycetota bacterium]|nr:hypothetical protein [Actinomycetota bacterium]
MSRCPNSSIPLCQIVASRCGLIGCTWMVFMLTSLPAALPTYWRESDAASSSLVDAAGASLL